MTVKKEFVYDDNGVVASTDMGWLLSAFDLLMGMFDQVGLQTNVHKTAEMVCRTFWAVRVWVDKAYTRRMTGKGRSFKEPQRE